MILYSVCGCKSVFLKAPHHGGLREDKKVVLKMEIFYSGPTPYLLNEISAAGAQVSAF